jgi:Raf kinase inhibitor-like YbhB/YbcL family protein
MDRMKIGSTLIFFFLLTIMIFSFSIASSKEGKTMGNLKITSSVFDNEGSIPSRYTCDGANINPPLKIENVPSAAKSLALIVDDPDAPSKTWVHWTAWNIDPKITEIKENSVPKGAVQGMNDFRKHNYGGPCPPSGTHRYYFKLYALDTMLDLGNHAEKPDLEKAMKGHIIGQTELMGKYKRA